MIKTNLYHKKVFWKKHFDKALCFLVNNDTIKVSSHIKNNTSNWCGHNKININKLIAIVYGCKNRINKHYLFEVETEYNTLTGFEKITKAVIRTEYNYNKDIIIVLRENMIITAWLNDKDDKHFTLDNKKYVNLIDK